LFVFFWLNEKGATQTVINMENDETSTSMPAGGRVDWNGSDASTGEVVCHDYHNVASTVVLSALDRMLIVPSSLVSIASRVSSMSSSSSSLSRHNRLSHQFCHRRHRPGCSLSSDPDHIIPTPAHHCHRHRRRSFT